MKTCTKNHGNLIHYILFLSLVGALALLFSTVTLSEQAIAKSGNHDKTTASKGHNGKGENGGGSSGHVSNGTSKGKGKSTNSSGASSIESTNTSSKSSGNSSSNKGNSSNSKGKSSGSGGKSSSVGKQDSNTSSRGANSGGNKGNSGDHRDADGDIQVSSDDSDSDRPAWAGKDGNHNLKPGGGNSGQDTKKGGEYGDLFVMDRKDDGTLNYYDADKNLCDSSDGCFPAAVITLEDGSTDLFVLIDDVDPPETVTEIELGRLNISRAPSKVLDHSLEEALSKLDGLDITLANLIASTDLSGRLLIPDSAVAIDSPLENLSLFQAILEAYDPSLDVIEISYENYKLTLDSAVVPQVLASTLAAASDKTHVITIDEVAYLSKFLEVEDKLNVLVEDYTDWYERDDFYNVQISVLDISADPPEWDTNTNLLDKVPFTSEADFTVIDDDYNGIDYFVMAADDSLQVLEFIHDSLINTD